MIAGNQAGLGPSQGSRDGPGDAPLVLNRLTKRFRGVAAVDDVSLTIPGGSFFSLLGPSGSGKSTLLMLVAGFAEADAGTVHLGPRDISDWRPERRNFGMVFQGYALFPHLSVAENVGFSLKVRRMGRSERESRIVRALDLVRMRGFESRMPRQLSGGQQQRVALARALVFEPDIVLLDEPLSALDKKLRARLQAELRDLQRRIGRTFLCVTHDQDEALSMSDEIAVLRDGRIVQRGSPEDLYERPATHFVADFLGESNFLEGRTIGAGDGLVAYAIGDAVLTQVAAPTEIGTPVLLALRPPKIELRSEEPTSGNRLPGVVRSWTYHGAELQCFIETPAGLLSVVHPTWRSNFAPATGHRLWLTWRPDAAVIVKDDRLGPIR